ncbi:hypothetical protein F5Y18DRAFT_433147 [Xylariaceae sp. FL1019]|nr:hypothetical protein F5Y18DRAFT_433147 [Xylariaceae sp. FL1019]
MSSPQQQHTDDLVAGSQQDGDHDTLTTQLNHILALQITIHSQLQQIAIRQEESDQRWEARHQQWEARYQQTRLLVIAVTGAFVAYQLGLSSIQMVCIGVLALGWYLQHQSRYIYIYIQHWI